MTPQDVLGANPQGSMWNRWDPHIHAPGTVLANRYGGADPWKDFLSEVEQSEPTISALGITDYLSVDLYERVVAEKRKGRLRQVALLFPNVEMRFSIATAKESAINFHLLVSPDDPNHVAEIRRFLLGLTFTYNGESYRCERNDLIRLGRAFNRAAAEEHVALRVGTNQFKVSHDQLREQLGASVWARDNVLIAVAGGSRDGTSGLQEDAAFAALRQELERSAHIIFSSQPKQREFWLGNGSVKLDDLMATYRGRKPCLHGSDAHEQATVGRPAERRFCWIKGDLTFESLRQACLEPENRAFIGPEPLRHAMPSQAIARLHVVDAPWLVTSAVPLNPGLIAIIGARGSGKTALADLIAAGGYALSKQLNDRSFVRRAAKLIGQAKASLAWEDGRITENAIEQVESEEFLESPLIQYLSQQFVDQLCSSEGLTDSLVEEVQRVVFQAHTPESRMGATTFAELLELRTGALRTARAREESLITTASDDLLVEQTRRDSLADLQRQREELTKAIAVDKRDRQSLIGQNQAERGRQLERVSDALSKVRGQVDAWTRRNQSLLALRSDVAAMRQSGAPNFLQKWKDKYSETDLSDVQWQEFRLEFAGDVDEVLDSSIRNATSNIAAWKGPQKGEVTPTSDAPPQAESLIAVGADLGQQTLTLLSAEVARLRGLIGIDAENTRKYNQLSEKIAKQEVALAKLDRDIEVAKRAGDRIKVLQQTRYDAYRSIFQAIEGEEQELSHLYGPLQKILEVEPGALGKLAFSVRRHVDVEGWAATAEKTLFDLRAGPFRGKGSLIHAIEEEGLASAWETGTAEDVASAMGKFREEYARRIMEHCPGDRQTRDERREWAGKVSAWLYGTDHITVSYGVQYDGVNIEQLSPGTRGIVLLLLYLSIDTEDDRPLIIDQPEENLDPKSIFVELVDRFKAAKNRRQIIIVTHNANLVINADADQVIVATAGSHRPGQLPLIQYESGGLENPEIRKQVCEILEGGEQAFKERAKRLRVSM
jgi:energy-coupling factor transporter ATP-binding protein EcfA2